MRQGIEINYRTGTVLRIFLQSQADVYGKLAGVKLQLGLYERR